MSEPLTLTATDWSDPRHTSLVVRFLELGKLLHKRTILESPFPWTEQGESWKKSDDDGTQLESVQAEVIDLIAHSDRAGLFKLKSTDRINPLVVRMLAITSYRCLFSDWSSMSVTNLAQATSIGDSIPALMAARRCAVALCQRGLLRFNAQGEICQTVWISKKLLEFVEDGEPLVVPQAPSSNSRGKDSREKPPVQTKPEDTP